jgi:ferrochelatase
MNGKCSVRTAVVLFNLGGPDSQKAVRPFLYNLFSDPAIIRLPFPLRQAVAWALSARREKTARHIYAQMGGGSPILANTVAQARALERALGDQGAVKCLVAMRYWHPFADEAIREIEAFKPDRLVLLPLYPQFSTTTTASSLNDFRKRWNGAKPEIICCYPDEPGFIAALAPPVRAVFDEVKERGGKPPRLLLSAHGLPEKIVQAGDPYPQQCRQTAEAVVKALNIPDLDWVLCYQSRVGPLKWIGPATDAEIDRAGRDGVSVVVAPVSFVSEHSETLVELGIECRRRAEKSGVPHFAVVPAVSTAPAFIGGLANLVRNALNGGGGSSHAL